LEAERSLAAKLAGIVRGVAHLVSGFDDPLDPDQQYTLNQALAHYSFAVKPWARAYATRMVAEADARNRHQWFKASAAISAGLEREINAAPVEWAMRALVDTQVDLIGSLPTEAARKVAMWTREGLVKGQRHEAIRERILNEIGTVTRARAELIARTETARVASVLTQARALSVGSTHYRWLATMDARTRPDHRRLHGQIFAWVNPPVSDERTGIRANPGCIWNCRCVAVPILE
jgi:SPP1 gp7 family putative phage head morphogenesis protein